jgi:protein-disulfide isomerase
MDLSVDSGVYRDPLRIGRVKMTEPNMLPKVKWVLLIIGITGFVGSYTAVRAQWVQINFMRGLLARVVKPESRLARKNSAQDAPAVVKEPVPERRYRIPLQGPYRGAKVPKVNVVAFLDFNCPFSVEAWEDTIPRILKAYPEQARFSFRYYPNVSAPESVAAAYAALEAIDQGFSFQIHDALFANRARQTPQDLEQYAQQIGLDMNRFRKAIALEIHRDRIDSDALLAQSARLEGTPTFYVNGRLVSGAIEYEKFESLVKDEIERANEALLKGATQESLYEKLTGEGALRPQQTLALAKPNPDLLYQVPLGTAPFKGAKEALLTVVQFSSFGCKSCRAVEKTVSGLMKDYEKYVRVAWRDLPDPAAQKSAVSSDQGPYFAAIAARAAQEQGAFWQMHAKLMYVPTLDRTSIEQVAQSLGLDMEQFRRDLVSNERARFQVVMDRDDAKRLGVGAPPALFINGRFVEGDQPYAKVKALAEEAVGFAQAYIDRRAPNVEVGDYYNELMNGAVLNPSKSPLVSDPEDNQQIQEVNVNGAPAMGPRNAPLKVVVFGDFRCGFTRQLRSVLQELEAAYPGQVERFWKNFPSDTEESQLAAQVAMEAAEQGKFRKMHDRLFDLRGALERDKAMILASEIGMDVGRLRKSLENKHHKIAIDADRWQAQTLGVTGTPTVFINGRTIAGLYPTEIFLQVAKQSLIELKAGPLVQARKLKRRATGNEGGREPEARSQ